MTRDEFERAKDAEKAHLRALKKLKDAVRTLKRKQRVTRAVVGMTEGMDRIREQETLVDALALETARHEARMDLALGRAGEQSTLGEAERRAVSDAISASRDADEAARTQSAQDAADLQADRARRLVAEMKVQLGVPAKEVPVSSKTLGRAESAHEGDHEGAESAAPVSPGVPKPATPASGAAPEDALPEKTIGRRRS